MKGIITKYLEDKGFGFIKDENEEERFFHVNNLKNKEIFLSNITDYYYTTWIERKCYVVSFNPTQNEKGLTASNIALTRQIFNDVTSYTELDALVTGVERYEASLTRTVSGIRKGSAKPIGATAGGNGTYRVGYPEVIKELNIHFRRIDDIGWDKIDVRDLALKVNNRKQITDKFVNAIKKELIGKNIRIKNSGLTWSLADDSVLQL